jgi:membrane protein implicated in regulation of membrane protease activity
MRREGGMALWWLWLLLGLVLLGVEMLTPGGFYFLFFGVAALVVGFLAGLGVAGPVWAQLVVFSVLSVAALAVLRPYLVRWTRSGERPDPVDTLVGDLAVLADDLAPGAYGKAELRGTPWTVLNHDQRPLARGQRVRVVRVDGLTLWVEAPEGGPS